MNPILSARDLCKEFESADGSKINALNGINFDIYENDFVCILGSNGSGKTTLLRVVTKEILPDSGYICFRKQNVTSLRDDHWLLFLGRIYQNPSEGLAPYLTVEEHLLLSLLKGEELSLFSSAYTKRNRNRLRALMKSFSIDFKFGLNQKVSELSGGQKQLLSLIMVYLQAPVILILDEPTASLDPQNSENIIKLLSQWANEKLSTILMVTHQVEVAFSIKNSRVLVLHQGKIKAELTSKDVCDLSVENFKQKYFR